MICDDTCNALWYIIHQKMQLGQQPTQSQTCDMADCLQTYRQAGREREVLVPIGVSWMNRMNRTQLNTNMVFKFFGARQFHNYVSVFGPGFSWQHLSAPSMQCACFRKDCGLCQQGGVFAMPLGAAVAVAQQKKRRKQNRKRKHTSKQYDGRTKRPVSQDVGIINKQCSFDHSAWLNEMSESNPQTQNPGFFPLSIKQKLLAFGCILPDGESWDFWELYAGCARLTAAVCETGLQAGPAVDFLPGAGLQLDLRKPAHQSFVWEVAQFFNVKWIHCGDPCTFWTNLGRCTALRTMEEWDQMREENLSHVRFTAHLLFHQMEKGLFGSRESPVSSGSWKICFWQHLFSKGFWRHNFDNCAFGLQDEFQRPLKKPGSLAANVFMPRLLRKCICGARKHGVVQGCVQCGPDKGLRRSTVAGRYTPEFTKVFANEMMQTIAG